MRRNIFVLMCFCKIIGGIVSNYASSSSQTAAVEVVSNFGMAKGGLVQIDFDISAPKFLVNQYSTSAYLLILTEQQVGGWYQGLSDSVASIQTNIGTLCNQPSLYRRQIFGKGNLTYILENNSQSSRYSVVVMQCKPLNSTLSISVEVSMLNPRPYSNTYTHLAIQDVMVARVLEGEIILYSLFLGAIIFQYFAEYRWFKKIHGLFGFSALCQLATVSVEYCVYMYYDHSGAETNSQQYAWNIVQHIESVVSLFTLLMLSLGWSNVRQVLSEKETRLIVGSISCYWLVGMIGATCLDTTSNACQSLYLITYVLKSLVFLGIIIAMNFTVTQLKVMLTHSPWVPTLPVQYELVRQFQLFRMAFIWYLILPTGILLLQGSIFSWKEDWVVFVLNELITIAMFVHVGVTFSPLNETLYLRAFDGSYQENQHTE